VDMGSGARVCQPAAGQQRSPAQPCCPGLRCTQSGTFSACDGTTACVCRFSG
jgi:hypothetical protein